MPSVVVNWTGQCQEESVRRDLCDQLAEIAAVAESFPTANPETKRFEQQIGGKILVSGTALELEDVHRALDAEKSPETSAGFSPVSSAEDLALNESASLVHTLRLSGPDYSSIFSLTDAALLGIEFRLPTIYHSEDLVSFVFLLCANPALNGIIVQPKDKQHCTRFESDIIGEADWFLNRPSIHLRYRFEEWMDFLLGWVKHFYIPQLRYWRYDPLPNYGWLFSKIDANDTRVKDQLLGTLKESLAMEFKGWPDLPGDSWQTSFWQKLNGLGTLAQFPPNLPR
jgi:hypothetical protein